jgi:hypothetical protein
VKALRTELEEQQMKAETLRKSESSTRTQSDIQASKLKDQIQAEKSGKEAAEQEARTLKSELANLKDFGRAKLLAFESEKAALQSTIDQFNADMSEAQEHRARLEAELTEARELAHLSASEG